MIDALEASDATGWKSAGQGREAAGTRPERRRARQSRDHCRCSS